MFDVRVIAVVAVGAGIGGVLRLVFTQFVVARFGVSLGFFATLFINVSGSFLIGLTVESAQIRADISPLWRYFIATGILGGYTTFSTFSFEALSMSTAAMPATAVFYVVSSVGLGIIGAFAGVATARAVVH